MISSQIQTLLFYLVFVFYILFAIYVLFINITSSRNRIFSLVCLAMGVWTYTIVAMNVTDDYNATLLWRRIGALGWGTVYSFLLHFSLIMTEKNLF